MKNTWNVQVGTVTNVKHFIYETSEAEKHNSFICATNRSPVKKNNFKCDVACFVFSQHFFTFDIYHFKAEKEVTLKIYAWHVFFKDRQIT